MFLRELDAPVTHVKGAGPALAKALAAAGVANVAALLSYYPRDWEDRSVSVPLREFSHAGTVCTEVEVVSHEWFGAGRMRTLKVRVRDATAEAALVCFNRPFLEGKLPVGARFRLWGRFFLKYGEIQSSAFEVEPVESLAQDGPDAGDAVADAPPSAAPRSSSSFGRILPVYPLAAGLSQGGLRRLMKRALADYGSRVEDELPASLRERDGLLPKARALAAVHFPSSPAELREARRTLVYEELFYLEVMVGRRAADRRKSVRPARPGPVRASDGLGPLQERLRERLPFRLTEGQLGALREIDADLDGDRPMARLLQGDVGSGKTLVAFMAALRVVESGGQAAIMAPTELLARQHAENAARLLEPIGIRLAFLTGNVKASGRGLLLKALANGEIDVVVGTHALFSRDVAYRDLRLVVVDEQHRFGVVQRAAILAKGEAPDLLMMSATPIPRTLALTVFGDLDVSVIRGMPPGRQPVATHLAKQSNEAKVYGFVRWELAAGRQAYFVYPLIEADEETALKDAQSMHRRLAAEVFPDRRVSLVHSRLDEEAKRQAMADFRAGAVQVLVATSVVEVGVDVPNATCMVVEHAERFGLSALHQLRGRVGRGKEKSYCFLVYSDDLKEDGKARLLAMLEHSDGFEIAEEDLKLRGPGQIAGIEQSGYLSLGIADPVRDSAELARARADAFDMLEKDPGLLEGDHRVVAQVLERAPPFASVIA